MIRRIGRCTFIFLSLVIEMMSKLPSCICANGENEVFLTALLMNVVSYVFFDCLLTYHHFFVTELTGKELKTFSNPLFHHGMHANDRSHFFLSLHYFGNVEYLRSRLPGTTSIKVLWIEVGTFLNLCSRRIVAVSY